MSRLPVASTTEYIKPKANIYTVLVVAAFVVLVLGLIALWSRYETLFPGEKLFGS